MKATMELPASVAVIEAALEGLVGANMVLIAEGLVPLSPVDAGVRYKKEPSGFEEWNIATKVVKLGHGDCEDLAAWECAGIRMTQDPGAMVIIEPVGTSSNYHATVLLSSGQRIDVCRELGMGAHPPGTVIRDHSGTTMATRVVSGAVGAEQPPYPPQYKNINVPINTNTGQPHIAWGSPRWSSTHKKYFYPQPKRAGDFDIDAGQRLWGVKKGEAQTGFPGGIFPGWAYISEQNMRAPQAPAGGGPIVRYHGGTSAATSTPVLTSSLFSDAPVTPQPPAGDAYDPYYDPNYDPYGWQGAGYGTYGPQFPYGDPYADYYPVRYEDLYDVPEEFLP